MAKVSQNISSESLFHFIKRRDWLLLVLKRKYFQARYVYEEIPVLQFKVGIPMKCFCDIPLGMIKKHISHYGRYGLGIKKDFAKKNSFSPIIYIHEKSDTLLRYLGSMKEKDIFKNPNSLLPYIKWDEQITLSSDGKKIRESFYDEREWRYIPQQPAFINFSGFDEDEIKKSKLEYENDILEKGSNNYKLSFEYSNITYIFVQKAEDVENVIDEIYKLKIDQRQRDILISKIITARQIERDF